jgi:hypothetical protein
MQRIAPDGLTASRTYLTQFDRVTYSQVAWSAEDVAGIVRNLERTLKLLSLVKGHVVIAASHLLESELARQIIGPHPELFSKHIVVPALASGFTTCRGFLESKLASESPGEAELYDGPEQREMADLIDEYALAVEWDLDATAGWFKRRLLADLRDGRSLVSLILKRHNLTTPAGLCARIEELPRISRGALYQLMKEPANTARWEILTTYADFIYYLAGATAVRSEGVLPQENIVDFRLDELAGRATPLSEHEVFVKIFIDIVKAETATWFPGDFLEAIDVPEAIALHGVAVDSRFVEKYNAIETKTKASLRLTDPESLVLRLEEIDQLEVELAAEFTRAIQQEIPSRQLDESERHAMEFMSAVGSLVVPAYGTALGVKELVVSGLRLAGHGDAASFVQEKVETGVEALREVVSGRPAGERAVLLGFVDKLKRQYARRMSQAITL